MAGPSAVVLLPSPITPLQADEIIADLHGRSSHREEENLWIEGRPFIYRLRPEYPEMLDEYIGEGLPEIIGWTPQDFINLIAMCNDAHDHRILAELCLHYAHQYDGLIDFTGPLLPLWEEDVRQRWVSRIRGEIDSDWSSFAPDSHRMVAGMPGHIYMLRYQLDEGGTWAHHVCDTEFMQAWLDHPYFYLVK